MKHVYKRKIISIIILLIFLLNLVPISRAEENVNLPQSGTSGTCSWEIDEDGNLTVRPTNGTEGTLASTPGNSNTGSPWYQYREQIKTVKFEGKVYTGTRARALFEGMTNCTSINTENLDTSKTTTMLRMFYGCNSLQSLDLSGFDTSKVTTMTNMFRGCSSLTSLDVSDFDTSSVTSMAYMFNNCSSLTSLNLNNFNTTSVTTMVNMFQDCSSLQSLDLSSFNTEAVTTMANMFRGCSSLTSLDVSDFDTSSVTTMAYMFNNCSSLTSLNLNNFNTTSVTIMENMFSGCSSLKELDISGFDTTSLENAWAMFGNGELQLEKIKLGGNTKLYGDEPKGDAFGRGTWKRQEDNSTYSAVELSTKPVAGTYVKISNISKDFAIDFPVTYKIGYLEKVDEFTTTRPDIYRMVGDSRVAADVNLPAATEYTLPGQLKLKFIDVVEDRFGNKYDFQLTIENVTYYDLDQVNEGETVGNAVSGILKLEDGLYQSHVALYENDVKLIAGDHITGLTAVSVKYDTTINILNKDGTKADGSFIFSAYDLDGATWRDRDSGYNENNATTRGYGNYSEGVYLNDGFDLSTIITSEYGITRVNGNRIYGIGHDNNSERTEFLVKGDANESKYTWTSRHSMGTYFINFYQPQTIEALKKDDAGNLVEGAKLAIYCGDNTSPLEEWVSSKTESKKLFLMPGEYILKEVETPEGYETSENITFFVDTNNSLLQNGETVANVVMTDNRKDARVIVHHYIEGTTTPVPLAKGGEAEDKIMKKKYYEDYETYPVDHSGEYELIEGLTTITPEGRKESGIVDADEIVVTYYYRLKKNTEIEEQEEEKKTDNNNTVIEEEKAEEKIIDEDNIVTSAKDKEKPSIPLTGVFQNYNSFVVLAVIGGLGLLAVSKKRLLFVKKHKYVGKRFK